MTTSNLSLPENFSVFLVGHCEEWPENREEQGDIALYREYLRAGVPRDNILFVKDGDCTQQNCQEQLEQFCTSSTASTLVFYYGGHGEPYGFQTLHDEWSFEQVATTIDRQFGGTRVLYLLDCCASGNMHRHVAGKQKQYVCITNTPPYVRATDEGDEWVVNHCWIQAMRASLSLEATMEFMADRLALVLGDQMVATVSHGVDCQCNDWMPRRRRQETTKTNPTNTLTWQRLEQHIPPDARVTAEDWSVGDVVFYKHSGGNPNDKTGYVPPGWLKATILSTHDDDNLLQLQVHYQDIPQWRVAARRDTLMNDWYMGQAWMLPDGYEKATVQLAQKYFKYMDYSIKPHQRVRTKEGKEAIILDWREFDWEEYMEKSSTKDSLQSPPFGAHVPVQWVVTNDNSNDNNNPQQTLLPVQWIQDHTAAAPFPLDHVPTEPDQQQHWARKALLQSIQSSGKQICHAATKLGKDDDIDIDSVMMIAYWPQDGDWYEAEPLDPETVSLQILASHAQFTLTGRYCPVAYEDGEFALTPMHYVRKTKRRQRSKHCPCLH